MKTSPAFRSGVKHVANEHLARMVDLTHALDPAPWTVDCNMKARVLGSSAFFPLRHHHHYHVKGFNAEV